MRKQTLRTIDEANAILREEGAVSWIGLTDPELLGCYPDQHERWLTTATEFDIRTWARHRADMCETEGLFEEVESDD